MWVGELETRYRAARVRKKNIVMSSTRNLSVLLTRIALALELLLLVTMEAGLDLAAPARVQASLLLLMGLYLGIIDIHVQRCIAGRIRHQASLLAQAMRYGVLRGRGLSAQFRAETPAA